MATPSGAGVVTPPPFAASAAACVPAAAAGWLVVSVAHRWMSGICTPSFSKPLCSQCMPSATPSAACSTWRGVGRQRSTYSCFSREEPAMNSCTM
jgi:hypothetical protein